MPIEKRHLYGHDPKHTSHAVKSWLDENQVNVMPWPAQSPDLNPIENLWMMVKRQIGKTIFKNGNDLIQIEKEWTYSNRVHKQTDSFNAQQIPRSY